VLRLGEIIETRPVFFARYYHTTEDGMRKQKAVKLCDRSDLCRSKANVQPLMDRVMESVNAGQGQIWNCYLKQHIGSFAHVSLSTAQITAVLTHLAKNGGRKKTGLGRYALSHIKFVLSGIYEYAIATGVCHVLESRWSTR
jgi:hypothetical protein